MNETNLKNTEKKYILTKHLVAYIDVLGIADKLTSNYSRITTVLLNNLWADIKNQDFLQGLDKDFNKIIFSDNIAITYDTYGKSQEEVSNACNRMAQYVMAMQVYGLPYDFIMRGAIVFGDLYVNTNMNFVCGEALVKAYKQENELAIFPRIISIDKEFLANLKEYDWSGGIITSNYIKYDFDQIAYLDFMKLAILDESQKDFIMESTKEEIIKLRDTYINEVKITQKHNWLINYFNNFCENNNLIKYKIQNIKG